MKHQLFFLIVMFHIFSCSPKRPTDTGLTNNLVLVKGGAFINKNSNLYGKDVEMSCFYIGKFEVTQKEWFAVMGFNPSHFKGDSLPVEMVSWYDAIEFCNKLSIKENLTPFYNIDKNKIDALNISEFDDQKWTVTFNFGANGYRLPTEVEWEYAASGGQYSKGYKYSGSNNIDEVAWYWRNSGEKKLEGSWHWDFLVKNNNNTKMVGSKQPNELNIYNMSGNVREWCNDWYEDKDIPIGIGRVIRGGGWMGSELRCEISSRDFFEANGIGPDQGFRVARSIN